MSDDAFYITIITLLVGLLVIAHYWLERQNSVIKEMAEALFKGGCYLEFATGVIAGQRERIAALEAELERLRESNVIDLKGRRQ